MKTAFRLTDEEFNQLMNACKPTPVMYLTGGVPMFDSPQENANRVWKELGSKHGFVWDSCEPNGNDPKDFMAEPFTPPSTNTALESSGS